MICSNCKEEWDNGTVENGKFICYRCQAFNLVKSVAKEHTAKKDWRLVEVLKTHGIQGKMAVKYVQDYNSEYLIRKIWLMRYLLFQQKVKQKYAMMKHIIERDYNEPDHFLEWMKRQKREYKKGDWRVLYE